MTLEHRRLNRPEGFEPVDCRPSDDEIRQLRHRAERLGYIIILEAYEPLESMQEKFRSVPGVIFISGGGELIARDSIQLPWPCIHEVTPPTQERVKVDSIHGLSRIAVPDKLTEELIKTNFDQCGINETILNDFDCQEDD